MTHRKFTIKKQPDDTTCGPTCLHAVYSFYGYKNNLNKIINEVEALEEGGTLAVLLGIHALKNGFKAKIFSYNLRVFDPTWSHLGKASLIKKLKQSAKFHHKGKLKLAINSYLEFLQLGGDILFGDLHSGLITKFLKKRNPVLTGLSSTYLYQSPREFGDSCVYDDVKGKPSGHFVVLYDYDKLTKKVSLADPWHKNPINSSQYYKVSMQRLINSILLGVLTYDANLLILEPKHA